MKIQSQNTIPTYENNVISNTIHINNYYIFVTKMQAFLFLSFFWDLLFCRLLFFFFFYFFSFYFFSCSKLFFSIIDHIFFYFSKFFFILIFSLNMHILCPTFGYCTNHPKKPGGILCFKCGYCKIILIKLMFILWPFPSISHWT